MNLPSNLKTLDEYSHIAVKDYPKPNRIVEINREAVELASSFPGGGKSSFAVHVKSLTSQQSMRKKDRFLTQSLQGGLPMEDRLGTLQPDYQVSSPGRH